MIVLTPEQMRRTLFPNFVCALVFEASYQMLLAQDPEMSRERFWIIISELETQLGRPN